jgi:hypothetical protein
MPCCQMFWVIVDCLVYVEPPFQLRQQMIAMMHDVLEIWVLNVKLRPPFQLQQQLKSVTTVTFSKCGSLVWSFFWYRGRLSDNNKLTPLTAWELFSYNKKSSFYQCFF